MPALESWRLSTSASSRVVYAILGCRPEVFVAVEPTSEVRAQLLNRDLGQRMALSLEQPNEWTAIDIHVISSALHLVRANNGHAARQHQDHPIRNFILHQIHTYPESISTQKLGEIMSEPDYQLGLYVREPDAAGPPVAVRAPKAKRISMLFFADTAVVHFPR